MLSKSHFCVATALPFEGLITDCLPLEEERRKLKIYIHLLRYSGKPFRHLILFFQFINGRYKNLIY